MATITDSTATDPAFVVERFAAAGDRLEVSGHWRGLRGRRFVRPVLWLHRGESRERLVAVLDHKPWAAGDGEPWVAAFKWHGGKLDAERAELEVGRELVVDLPLPGGAAPKPLPAKPRPPSELERVREQLLSATRERRELEVALDAATAQADKLARVREERDRAREDAERARADGERLVNDEYRQRERAQEAAEQATARAREADAARRLAERQLTAAREAHAALEARLADVEAEHEQRLAEVEAEHDRRLAERQRLVAALEADLAEAKAAGETAGDDERERLRAELAGAEEAREALAEERDRLRAELVAANEDRVAGAESKRLERELAGAWAERDHLATDLAAARAGRERVEAELVAARGDRKRLERELSELRSERERHDLPRPHPRRPSGESRLAPPSGSALWAVRLVALSLVAILLAAITLLLTGVL
jgi:hypothetical protein